MDSILPDLSSYYEQVRVQGKPAFAEVQALRLPDGRLQGALNFHDDSAFDGHGGGRELSMPELQALIGKLTELREVLDLTAALQQKA